MHIELRPTAPHEIVDRLLRRAQALGQVELVQELRGRVPGLPHAVAAQRQRPLVAVPLAGVWLLVLVVPCLELGLGGDHAC